MTGYMSQSNKDNYAEKLNAITEYIQKNFDAPIRLEELAQISHISPYHFHKMMRAMLGEPIGAYIIRVRLEHAARAVTYGRESIEQIAFSVGYESAAAFSKQFKNHFGVSPINYRKQKITIMKKTTYADLDLDIKKPKQVQLGERKALFVTLTGKYHEMDMGSAWQKLWQEVKEQKLFTAGIEHIGIPYDDPAVTDSEKIRYDACLVVHKEASPMGEVGVKTLPGGKYMMFLYTGSYKHLSEVYDYIFNEWLINSEYQLRDEPVHEKYRNNPERTEEQKLKTEIYLPIR